MCNTICNLSKLLSFSLQLATSAKVLDNQVSVSQRKIQRDTLLGHSMVAGSDIVQKMIIFMKFLEYNNGACLRDMQNTIFSKFIESQLKQEEELVPA